MAKGFYLKLAWANIRRSREVYLPYMIACAIIGGIYFLVCGFAMSTELAAVPGVGESSALLISLIPQIMRRYLTVKGSCVSTISGSADAGRYLVPRLMFEKDEKLLLLCLDAKKSVISCVNLGSGVVNAVDVNVRKIVENAVRHRANTVILAHNHPGGVALPSREDERLTIEIAAALKLVGIPLVDHIIVAGDDYVSFADSGMMSLSNG